MKKVLFLFAILFLCGVNSVNASVGDIFIVKNSDSKTCLKMLNENLKNASLENNILYSSQDKFYYHIYQDGVNVNIFVVDEGQNKNVVKEAKLNIYPLEDNDLRKIYTEDFNSFISLNNLSYKSAKRTKDNVYSPQKELSNKVLKTIICDEADIKIVCKKLKMKTKIHNYYEGYEFVIINNSSKKIVLKKIESLDFVGLSEVAKKAIILQGVDFIPIYGIVAGVKTDIEKNLFTRPFPNNYSIGQNEQLRILALSKLMVEPIVDFTFEVDGRKKIIKICTYK